MEKLFVVFDIDLPVIQEPAEGRWRCQPVVEAGLRMERMGPTHDEGGATLSLPLCAETELQAVIDTMAKMIKRGQ